MILRLLIIIGIGSLSGCVWTRSLAGDHLSPSEIPLTFVLCGHWVRHLHLHKAFPFLNVTNGHNHINHEQR